MWLQVWAQGFELDASAATAELFTLLLQVLSCRPWLPRALADNQACTHRHTVEQQTHTSSACKAAGGHTPSLCLDYNLVSRLRRISTATV